MNPLQQFQEWHSQECEQNSMNFPNACCLSTVGLDGYPNSRFVSLKEIVDESFIITGPMSSRKGQEIENCPKAALAFWWTSTERQIRIQGNAFTIPESDAKKYFAERNRDSKIVSMLFDQGKEIQSIQHLQELFAEKKKELGNTDIECPEHWGGISINPLRIEFMDFHKSRLHERTLYKKVENTWQPFILQP
jgi:pyridoxamine 5'-phosphate oxidase